MNKHTVNNKIISCTMQNCDIKADLLLQDDHKSKTLSTNPTITLQAAYF